MSKIEGAISYQPNSILRVNHKIIEIDDVTPDELASFVLDHQDAILARIKSRYELNMRKARNKDALKPMSILLARIGMQGRNHEVFTPMGCQLERLQHATPEYLKAEMRRYWEAIGRTALLPTVHVRVGVNVSEGTTGIWLGGDAPRR
jgi:hypothetical protein